jgi:hypothetical protein
MADLEDTEVYDEPEHGEIPDEEPVPEVKKGKKGMRRSVPATPERLEILRLARIKALEVRKQKAIETGKGALREEKRQNALNNRKKAEDDMNAKIEAEVQKRLSNLGISNQMDKIDELVEAKFKALQVSKSEEPPARRKKKVVYETDSDTDTEVYVKKKSVRPPPPVQEQPPQNPFMDFQNQIQNAMFNNPAMYGRRF